MKIVFDTETTGLDAYGLFGPADEILTIGIIDFDGNVIFDGRYRPRRRKRWADAARVNGIWPKDVIGLPTITKDIPLIKEIFDSAELIAGYNVNFDLDFITMLGIVVDPDRIIKDDPMVRFAEIFGEWASWADGWKWQKLTTAARYIGYDWGGERAHGSIADARATLALIHWLDERAKLGNLVK